MKALPVSLSAIFVVLAVYALLHVLAYFVQDRLLFFPQPLTDEMRAAVRRAKPDAREIDLPTADGHRLHGWFLPNGAPPHDAPALIYFGGNGEEVSHVALDAGELRGISLVLVDYRGYGKSTGEPGEKALFSDALAIYDEVASFPGIDPKRIVAMGRSLGSGVATYLASRRPVAAVVLVTPYDSITAVARAHYPFLLVGLVLRNRFESARRAHAIDTPMLALIAGNDRIVPPARGAALVKAWRGPATSVVIPGAGHNDIGFAPAYWPSIRDFLRKTGTALK